MRCALARALWPRQSPERTLTTYAWCLRPPPTTRCSRNGSVTVGRTRPTGSYALPWRRLTRPGGRGPYPPTAASTATPATWRCTVGDVNRSQPAAEVVADLVRLL